MAVRERTKIHEREKWMAQLLREYPPIHRLEELMGPEPTPGEAGEVDAFLQASARWQQPYTASNDAR